MRKFLAAAVPVLVLVASLTACSEGPAERTGRNIDNAGASIRDTIDPPKGPVEKAGRNIDRALD